MAGVTAKRRALIYPHLIGGGRVNPKKEFQELRVLIDRQFEMENALIDKNKELQTLAASRSELLREVLKAYYEGIGSPLEFDEWIRAMDRVYGWELEEELGDG